MEVEALQADPGKPFLENQQHVMELMQQRYGTIPAWMLVLMGLPILGGVLWLGAIGCAIVGVRSPSGRALSLAAFALCCVSPMLCCCGPMLVATLT
ncbi:MAG: hypothetical protein IT449_03020 [Phycisphaerales bacterium]|nr:hypothetical protein [Phycisphaerales bacterium]